MGGEGMSGAQREEAIGDAGASAPPSADGPPGGHVAWLAGLSPWPVDGFGLDRMHALLTALDEPQLRYPAVHVVGTNGKSTATVTIEQLLLEDGLSVGSTLSPHVRSWAERIRVGGRPVDMEAALARIRPAAERLGATQFESVTAAALSAFADAGVDVAVVEAGLGGRLDATNVLRSRVVLLTNVGLEHTDVLGPTVDAIAREKLAVVHTDDTVVVLPDDTFRPLVPRGRILLGGAREAAEAFAAHALGPTPEISLPGRLERRGAEIRDGAHNPDGVAWLVGRLDRADYTVCASILADKDVDEMLRLLATVGGRFVATASSNARSLPALALAEHARRYFAQAEAVAEPAAAVRRAHELGEPVLVTGSLYLLADLEAAG
jgi:dihydrofolate synthase/folylpolyglutamate synthase